MEFSKKLMSLKLKLKKLIYYCNLLFAASIVIILANRFHVK